MTDCHCESCDDYTSRVWVRILIVLALLVIGVTCYALIGDPLLSLAATFLGGGWMGDYIA